METILMNSENNRISLILVDYYSIFAHEANLKTNAEYVALSTRSV